MTYQIIRVLFLIIKTNNIPVKDIKMSNSFEEIVYINKLVKEFYGFDRTDQDALVYK